MSRIRILHVIHGLNVGGAEMFIYNLLLRIDDKFQFDFAIQNPNINFKLFEKLIYERGGKIHIIPDFMEAPLAQVKALNKLLRDGYDFVHIHMNAFINPIPAYVAGKYTNKVIIHSHNTSSAGGFIGSIIHKFNRLVFTKKSFIRLACGNDAGHWMFRNNGYIVVNNAVDLDKYAFDKNKRKSVLDKLGLKDEFIIGQVGRLISVKNQKFTLDVLKKINDLYPEKSVKVIFVGNGCLKSELELYAMELGLTDKVIFTGNVSNVEDYYMAFDCLILPSLFEGLAFVAVEAQASGLPIIASNCNSKEIDLSGYVRFLSLNDEKSLWANELLKWDNFKDRLIISQSLVGTKYDLNFLVKKMEKIYTAE